MNLQLSHSLACCEYCNGHSLVSLPFLHISNAFYVAKQTQKCEKYCGISRVKNRRSIRIARPTIRVHIFDAIHPHHNRRHSQSISHREHLLPPNEQKWKMLAQRISLVPIRFNFFLRHFEDIRSHFILQKMFAFTEEERERAKAIFHLDFHRNHFADWKWCQYCMHIFLSTL